MAKKAKNLVLIDFQSIIRYMPKNYNPVYFLYEILNTYKTVGSLEQCPSDSNFVAMLDNLSSVRKEDIFEGYKASLKQTVLEGYLNTEAGLLALLPSLGIACKHNYYYECSEAIVIEIMKNLSQYEKIYVVTGDESLLQTLAVSDTVEVIYFGNTSNLQAKPVSIDYREYGATVPYLLALIGSNYYQFSGFVIANDYVFDKGIVAYNCYKRNKPLEFLEWLRKVCSYNDVQAVKSKYEFNLSLVLLDPYSLKQVPESTTPPCPNRTDFVRLYKNMYPVPPTGGAIKYTNTNSIEAIYDFFTERFK